MRKTLLKQFLSLFIFVLLVSSTLALAQSAAKNQPSDRAQASELIWQNRYLDALPLLEKIAKTNPTDAEFWTHYSFALYTRSQTLDSADARKKARRAARNAALKARDLGSTNSLVLEIIEGTSDDGGSGTFSDNAEVNAAIIEAEKLFGRGEYDKALIAYERVLKLDPKNYEATVFAGDTFYARKLYKESEAWFAKAVAIDPNREMAYRFWGDALMLQDKVTEARDKYIEALVSEPYSRLAWEKLTSWAEASGNGWTPKGISPPGGRTFGEILIDEKLLKAEDGTKSWLLYKSTREQWKKQLFKKEFSNAKQYRHTLREEAAALGAVADAAKSDVRTGKSKTLDHSLSNLIQINDAGLLEAYILFVRINDEIVEDYVEYRKNNRSKLRHFILDFLIGTKDTLKVE